MLVSNFSESDPVLAGLPYEARQWLEGLPWAQRRYVLSLCHVMCATPPEIQAEFLDDYTADGVISRIIHDQDTQQRVYLHLERFCIETQLSEPLLRRYIRQFYMHSAQTSQHTNIYLETALQLMSSTQEHNSILSYILGFELLKLLFQMSWEQHEKLYRLQASQEDFIRTYIRPIQTAHRLNGIIVPKNETQFFARRDYFIQRPQLSPKRLDTLVRATFTADTVVQIGFSIMRHPNAVQFDHDHIYGDNSNHVTILNG
ncbi:MAG: cobyrinic acid a,c-diamide synthase [Cyanobacteria bacterium P01_G01_bin.38]